MKIGARKPTHTMKHALALLAALLLAPPEGLTAAEPSKPNIVLILADAQPNIILIMADDFGYECLTANGGQSYKTPHLDRLAEAGVRFEQCHFYSCLMASIGYRRDA